MCMSIICSFVFPSAVILYRGAQSLQKMIVRYRWRNRSIANLDGEMQEKQILFVDAVAFSSGLLECYQTQLYAN